MSLRSLRAGLRRLLHRDAADRELADEITHYLELSAEEHRRRGLTPADAERAARVDFGGVEAAKERVRTSGWESIVETVWQDVRYAWRGLRRNPLFTLATAATLALGIGVNTAMFSVLNTVMLRPLPYPDSGRLLLLFTDDIKRGLHFEATAYATVADWQRENRTFDGIAFFGTGRATYTFGDARERTRIASTSANLLPLIGVAPAKGRWLTDDDEREAAPVAIISHALWQRRFASDPDVIGKTLPMDDLQSKDGRSTLTIVGVMPPDFYFPDRFTDIWIPARAYWRWDRERTERFPSWARHWTAVGRLKAGASLTEARADLARIAQQLTAAYPTDMPEFPGFAVNAISMLDFRTGDQLPRALWLLMGAVVLVLLVACANVGNLLLARGAARQHEIAVRRAVGATRLRLVRQFFVESMLLALAGGAIGVVVALWTTRLIATAAANRLPRIDEIAIDLNVLAFAALVSIASGVLFGLVPAWRVTAHDGAGWLKDAATIGGGARIRRTRSVLVVVECTLAVLLLVGAGLLLRSLARVRAVDPGFDASGVVLVRVEFPKQIPPLEEVLARLRRLPTVSSVGMVDDLFIAGQGRQSVTFPGRDAASFEPGELADGFVSPAFFSTMRVPLRRGRFLTDADAQTKARALGTVIPRELPLAEKASRAIAEPVVVNEAFVRRFLAATEPIGQRFCIDPTNKTYCYEIAGVVGDMRRSGPERRTIPQYFGPLMANPGARADFVVRTDGSPAASASSIAALIKEAIPGALVPSVAMADTAFGDFTAQRNLQTWLLTLFATLTLALAAIGIYGVVHYAVSQRTREIGVRMALGARPRDVLAMVVAGGMRLPLLGIALGLGAAFAASRVISSLLFEVGATDLPTFALGAATLVAVALLACYAPARRAARLDAVRALRLD